MGSTERRGYRFTIITGVPGAGKTSLMRMIGYRVPVHMKTAAPVFRYRPTVFVAPPWPEIYMTDAERQQSYAEAVATCDTVRAAYLNHGYEPVDLPMAPVAERADFVLARR